MFGDCTSWESQHFIAAFAPACGFFDDYFWCVSFLAIDNTMILICSIVQVFYKIPSIVMYLMNSDGCSQDDVTTCFLACSCLPIVGAFSSFVRSASWKLTAPMEAKEAKAAGCGCRNLLSAGWSPEMAGVCRRLEDQRLWATSHLHPTWRKLASLKRHRENPYRWSGWHRWASEKNVFFGSRAQFWGKSRYLAYLLSLLIPKSQAGQSITSNLLLPFFIFFQRGS